MGSQHAISIRELSKSFGAIRALDGLSLEVARGEVHALLGPNGAGKSTAIRILLGLLRKGGGEVSVLGLNPWEHAPRLHRTLAYVPGDVQLWPHLTGGEAIDLFARLRGSVNARKRDELIARFELDPRKKGRTYSKGNRQKVALISALASDARLLVLDEPTSGLDPLMEAVFQDCIREAKAAGVTVLLSSHILAQVEVLADRISIMRAGAIEETGTLFDLRHLSRTVVAARAARPLPHIASLPGVHNVRESGGEIRLDVEPATLPELMRELAACDVTALTASAPTLEQVLLRHYGEDRRRSVQ